MKGGICVTIFDKVPGMPGYIVASIGFEKKSDAYDDIRNYRQGVTCTTYYDRAEKLWYIIEKR